MFSIGWPGRYTSGNPRRKFVTGPGRITSGPPYVCASEYVTDPMPQRTKQQLRRCPPPEGDANQSDGLPDRKIVPAYGQRLSRSTVLKREQGEAPPAMEKSPPALKNSASHGSFTLE